MLRSTLRAYSTTSIKYGIRTKLKAYWKEGEKQRHKEFQSWAEFENRGFKKPEYMTSWIIEQYGYPSEVLKKDLINVQYDKFKSIDARHERVRQQVKNPNDILVKVHAASINPIDVKMCQGYGKQLINLRRSWLLNIVTKFSSRVEHTEFPLVLGRDFSGTVVDIGSGVHDIVPGDEIFGTQELHRLGTLAEYASVHLSSVCHKPATLSHVEAAAIPYVSQTAAAALGSFLKNSTGKRALLLGGSGGVGTFCIQYLKAHGVNVSVTCSPDSVSLCSDLGTDSCYDYTSDTWKREVGEDARFDLVFDIFGVESPEWAVDILNKGGTYATLHTPLMRNTDHYGLILGLSAAASDLLQTKLNKSGIDIKWGIFTPNRHELMNVAKLVDSGAIKPVIHKVLDFEKVPEGFEILTKGGIKGKVVINVSGLEEATKRPDAEKIIHL